MSARLPILHLSTAKAVAKAVGVAFEPWMQDWPIEVSDPKRIEEFLSYYGAEQNQEYRLAVAILIAASLDDSFGSVTPATSVLDRAASVLKNHPEIIEYWSCLDAHTDDEMFPMTFWIRTL